MIDYSSSLCHDSFSALRCADRAGLLVPDSQRCKSVLMTKTSTTCPAVETSRSGGIQNLHCFIIFFSVFLFEKQALLVQGVYVRARARFAVHPACCIFQLPSVARPSLLAPGDQLLGRGF